MSLISALARMEAVASGRATPLATVRHRQLAARPLVLVPLTTAGETGAPLGALVGTEREAPELLTIPQPRDRDLRFTFLARLAEALLPHLESCQDEVELIERKETDPETGKRVTVEAELCADAPQILVPSAPGVSFVRLLGRSMRFRRTAEEDPQASYPAPARVPLLGRWLTHYAERARVPGSSLLLPMTGLLTRHWATGQSNLEDQHLGALLAWIAPPEGGSGADAALRAELGRDERGQLLVPPAGPATDPAFDNRLLAPAIARYDKGVPGAEAEVRELIASQLRPTWEAMWHGVDLLRALPEAGHVPDRWRRDRQSYTHHRDRLRSGEPPQPRTDDAVTAARKLAMREQRQAELAAQEALDDPLVMAVRRLAGEAFQSEVTGVERAYSEGKRPTPRPLVTVRTSDVPLLTGGGPALPEAGGDKLHRALPEGGQQRAELVESPEPGVFTLRLLSGMGRGKEPAPGTVPEPGETVCWTLFEHAPRGGPGLPEPEETPWTHGGPPGEPAAEEPDPLTQEDLL
ncbi:hypothetical protein OIE63_25440 [Streptomyces sp. NBC_01795]|uniref:hypothetical protein n=1 Tax=unclassified Streptomyces TaxID=2593676 RepID=UPI002DDBC10B|nr:MULTISPECIES: hypothetical protein [unclassified Streptomyces]WSA94539.1 hypothetical protein OIE63_25440 [Streptomyces sp. NBC_01795]WSB78959.1 hypothetical protein OHB04_26560 [Streptomyces sp. NBC_01775]WSS12839.1 hypothetical protein OG533_13670 [Streptomyces sp. NBC_01186]